MRWAWTCLVVAELAAANSGLMAMHEVSLYPGLTVMESIKFSRRLKANRELLASADVKAASGRSDALLQLIGRGRVAGAHPNRLSAGMQQRMAIARALMGRPRVLLPAEREQEMKHPPDFRVLRAEILACIRTSAGVSTDLEQAGKLDVPDPTA